MKKLIKTVENNICDLLGDETIKGRTISFKILVGILVLGITVFVLFNLVQLAL